MLLVFYNQQWLAYGGFMQSVVGSLSLCSSSTVPVSTEQLCAAGHCG